MDAGAIIALAAVIVTVLGLVFGGIIRYLVGKVDRLEAEAKVLADRYETKLDLAERTVDAKQETIEELRRQVSKLEITTEISNRLMDQLPKHLPPISGDK